MATIVKTADTSNHNRKQSAVVCSWLPLMEKFVKIMVSAMVKVTATSHLEREIIGSNPIESERTRSQTWLRHLTYRCRFFLAELFGHEKYGVVA